MNVRPGEETAYVRLGHRSSFLAKGPGSGDQAIKFGEQAIKVREQAREVMASNTRQRPDKH